MRQIKQCLLSFLFFVLLWLLLAGWNDRNEIIAGIIFSAVVTCLFRRSTALFSDISLKPLSLLYALLYPFVFSFELVKSNIDVARRVITPSLPINPGIVEVKTVLRSRLGRLILANSITLTPGTLTVETKDDRFFIHWIDVTSPDIQEASDRIVRKFEKYLEVIFG